MIEKEIKTELKIVQQEDMIKPYRRAANSKTRFTESIVLKTEQLTNLNLIPNLDPITAGIFNLGNARGYSPRTLQTYIYYNKDFLKENKKSEKDILEQDVYVYLNNRPIQSHSKTLILSSLKFYYNEVLGRKEVFENIKFPKKPKTLPYVLKRSELEKYINSIDNNLAKLMVEFIYSTGVRVDEFCKMKWEDLDLNTGIGIVKGSQMGGGGKENKDRPIELIFKRESILERLKIYKEKGTIGKYYIFDADSPGVRYIVKLYGKRAGFPKIHPHTLRHCFATHFYMATNDLKKLQLLLGHEDINMTAKYVTLANMETNQLPGNLLDFLKINPINSEHC